MNHRPWPAPAASRLPVLVASFLGSGFSRVAPGTFGTLAAMLPGIVLCRQPWMLCAAILLASAAGLWAIPRASGGADHGWIVIDEVAGIWITLLGIPRLHSLAWPPTLPSVLWFVAAFAMFRLLDITKPGPVGYMDRRHDAVGVMGDDIVAGLIGCLLLRLAGWVIL
ncbi:phosphatidylglycerophosphatase A family protein [Lichenicoccus roseus]|uniref:phosphatidylglycerophosphatase A family protein n=1 Tax=Lichenicoccus roseus TaxID=2683649 RepID=UPI001F0F0ED5|nr:phosphatidylglycerophosphatase A [Lichenicoccus roseus]